MKTLKKYISREKAIKVFILVATLMLILTSFLPIILQAMN